MTNDIKTLRELREYFSRQQITLSHVGGISTDNAVAALTRIIAAIENPDEHAKVLLRLAELFIEEGEAVGKATLGENGADALRAGALALGQQAAKDKRNAELTEALDFYADPETYFAIGFFPDAPCGDFMEDFSDDHGSEFIDGPKPGKRARRALAGDGNE